MKMLRITGCSDPALWYADKVGELVPYEGKWLEGYQSREPDGYRNVVRYRDAEIVDAPDGEPT